MRQIFSSQRVETTESVAQLLREAGIEVVVRNGQSYRGKLGGGFSFSEPKPANQQPSVWVRFADDQLRARELLRAQGLLDSTRPEQRESYAMGLAYNEDAPKRSWAWRIRLILLAVIAAVAMLMWLHRPAPPKPVYLPPTDNTLAPDEERVPIHFEHVAPAKK